MECASLIAPGVVEFVRQDSGIGVKPLLDVEVCGVCATDRKAFNRPPGSMALPRVLGHECCGTLVDQLGSLPAGTRVVLWPGLACGLCSACISGRPQLCAELQLFGLHLDGAFATTLAVPAEFWQRGVVLPLPPALASGQAVFAEPLGCVVHGLNMACRIPDKVMIVGAGLMGRLACQAARHRWPESEVAVVDTSPARRQALIGKVRVLAHPEAADLIFIACSSATAVNIALDHLNPGGIGILFSGLPPADCRLNLDHNRLHRQEHILAGSYGCTPQDMADALELLVQGAVVVDDLISRTLPLAGVAAELARPLGPHDYKSVLIA